MDELPISAPRDNNLAQIASLVMTWLVARTNARGARLRISHSAGEQLVDLVAVGETTGTPSVVVGLRHAGRGELALFLDRSEPRDETRFLVVSVADLVSWLIGQPGIGIMPHVAMRRILPVTEEELSRIVLDIHDGPVQYLFAALSQVAVLQGLQEEQANTPAAQQALSNISELLATALREIKYFLGTFRPPEFHRRDLLSIVEGLVLQHEEWTGDTVTLEAEPTPPNVALPVKIALYRIVQEALSNSHRHAGVREQRVRLWSEDETICLEVSDQGSGFEPPLMEGPGGTEREEHIGLRGMRERVSLVGGRFHLESRPGAGTRITVKVPRHG